MFQRRSKSPILTLVTHITVNGFEVSNPEVGDVVNRAFFVMKIGQPTTSQLSVDELGT